MAPARSIASFVRFTRIAGVIAFIAFASVGLRDERAKACGFYGPSSITELTTFDDTIIGEADGLTYEPYTHGFGESCDDCFAKANLAAWQSYLKTETTADDWQKVMAAGDAEVTAMRKRAKGNLRAALAVIELAKKVEPNATLSADAPPAPDLLAEAQRGLKAARDPFIAQRYAFQVMRILFYQRNWKGAVTFFNQNVGKLEAPSVDLGWRAHYYMAGALQRAGDPARAYLESARIHAGYAPLSGQILEEFRPDEDASWQDALKLAKNVREKTMLWRMVGIRQDGIAAAQEIMKLDPKSNLIALLVVRELAKAESQSYAWDGTPEPSAVAETDKAYKAIEQLCTKLAATPGVDRPWLHELVLGHIAAKRGNVAAAKQHLQKAVAARPDEPRVRIQAQASLALALAHDYKIDPKRDDEIAAAMNGLDKSFTRLDTVDSEVRHTLAAAYAKAGRSVDAEFLASGAATATWDTKFIKQMLARVQQQTTEFDKFVVGRSPHNTSELTTELAARYAVDGDFAAAAKTLRAAKLESGKLGTDPFVIHILDCHDCDHETYASAPWTDASVYDKLAALEKAANGKGEAAADAAFQIGNALYNITYYGNARVLLGNTHQADVTAKASERWYKRAFDQSKNRELKVKAAFMAAKAEQAQALAAEQTMALVPAQPRWFPVVKQFKDTKYYKEILRECGVFRAWSGK
jgi:hypothetical protein